MAYLTEKDIGKPGKNFSKIAAKASKEYGSEEAGKRVAGAILAKLRAKHPRKYSAKVAKEEVESIEEISKGLLNNYIKKAKNSSDQAKEDADKLDKEGNYSDANDQEDKAFKRDNGIKKAKKKLDGSAKVNATEEVEEIEEISTELASDYLEKASDNVNSRANHIASQLKKGKKLTGGLLKMDLRNLKRVKSMELAWNKATKNSKAKVFTSEEAENIEEISKDLAYRYGKKANDESGKLYGKVLKVLVSKKPDEQVSKDLDKADKRSRGAILALSKIHKTAKVPANEEAENINELSKGKLWKYMIKVENSKDKNNENRQIGMKMAASKRYGASKVPATNEEVEEIDEISKGLAVRYSDSAKKDEAMRSAHIAKAEAKGDYRKGLEHMKEKNRKRRKSIGIATSKAFGTGKVKILAKEENLDELSSRKLGKYIKKASKDIDTIAFDHGGNFYTKDASVDDEARKDHIESEKKLSNRKKGINKAVNKLVKRTNEEIVDEGKTFKDRKDYLNGKKSESFRRALKKNSLIRNIARQKRTIDDHLTHSTKD